MRLSRGWRYDRAIAREVPSLYSGHHAPAVSSANARPEVAGVFVSKGRAPLLRATLSIVQLARRRLPFAFGNAPHRNAIEGLYVVHEFMQERSAGA
jgi:hypothetical protein